MNPTTCLHCGREYMPRNSRRGMYCPDCRRKVAVKKKHILFEGCHKNHPRVPRLAGSKRVFAGANEMALRQLDRFLGLVVQRFREHPGASRRKRIGIISHTFVQVAGYPGSGLRRAA